MHCTPSSAKIPLLEKHADETEPRPKFREPNYVESDGHECASSSYYWQA